ncbi:putative phagocytic receptor 1a [Tritrichomonas foetus]|uniref:Transmembrane 9 superfamily member n=1 Tax=Tritrichomonas foetus TaxID=1144522 RepID=A0A1J4J792_9EUKA|nr:putative phagocytic receptor 1a [Tritrichomonas foetus]|eukprot:OHS95094.1 putative phagocytic receptor 1a [Tritrichomonas foetus]
MFSVFFIFSKSLYFPGNLPNNFRLHERINVSVNALRSSIRPIPLDYFKNDVFCSREMTGDLRTNIGEYLSGDALHFSPYFFNVGDDEKCLSLCQKNYSETQKKYLMNLIDNKYRIVFILDDIPVSFIDNQNGNLIRSPGFEIGYKENGEYFLNNHVNFKVKTLKVDEDIRIVGFDIKSIENSADGCSKTSKISLNNQNSFTFSYSVQFEPTNVDWNKRWNELLTIDYSPKYHWISVCNTLLLVLVLSFIISFILFRIIKHDLRSIDDEQDPLDEAGWQLIHGDVFRAPVHSERLCALVGSGFQLLLGAGIVLGVAAIGFLAPLNMGSMITTIAVVFIVAAPFGGFLSSKLFHSIGDVNWKKNILRSAFCFILPSLILYFLVNFIFIRNESTAALTFHSLFELLILIGVIDFALFFIGSIIGLRVNPFDFPTRINNLPRQIPKQPWFLHPLFTALAGGLAIFSVYFVECYFIYRSLWTNLSYYYLFGLLFVVFLAMQIISFEISICFVYLHLIYENYNWWWAAFRIPASSGIMLFIYSIFYMVSRYHPPDLSSIAIYLIFSAIFAFALALANGTIGFIFSLMFVQKIYAVLKME